MLGQRAVPRRDSDVRDLRRGNLAQGSMSPSWTSDDELLRALQERKTEPSFPEIEVAG